MARAYCAAVGIAFRPDALAWRPESRPEWRPSERWHADASASNGFTAPGKNYGPVIDTHPALGAYLRHHLPFYEEMHARRLTVS